MKVIDSFREEYAFLSNFYDCTVRVGKWTFHNTESAFQGFKSLIGNEMERFQYMSGGAAKRAGRHVLMRSDWEEVRCGCMFYVNMQKYTQNPDLRQMLLATGDAILIEGNTWNDTYWGRCKGKGANILGKILMTCRAVLKYDSVMCIDSEGLGLRATFWPSGEQMVIKTKEELPRGITDCRVVDAYTIAIVADGKEHEVLVPKEYISNCMRPNMPTVINVPYNFLRRRLAEYT